MDWTTERDACGIGFVADAHGRSSRRIVDAALQGLRNVRHRGAVDADARTGDGAGLLAPIPRPLAAWLASGLALDAPPGRLGIAMCFLDGRTGGEGVAAQAAARGIVERAGAEEGIPVLAWRPVPVVPDALGDRARATAPRIEQALVNRPPGEDDDAAERRCFRARRRAERAARDAGVRLYVSSLSFRTVTYKALCAADQLAAFYPDLTDPDFAAPFAVFHQRYSTNTLPTWERAQPFRFLCHNGEINTIQGNVNLMRARESDLGDGAPAAAHLIRPVIDESGSDSAMLDNAVELLVRGGRDLRHALAMLVPEAWEAIPDLPEPVRDFYRYHACLTEPWDGPAGLIFTDGLRVGAALDRNGLRPLRYAVCEDGLVACASEAGAIDTDGHGRVRRGKLGPGQMLCVDPDGDGVQEDEAIKARLAARRPYGSWLRAELRPADLREEEESPVPDDLVARQVTFGFTKEEITVVLRPLAVQGHEPTSSMGDDTAPAALANRPRPVTGYLKQRFAQVTNPPIDHLRERLVMSTRTVLGPRAPILDEGPEAASLVELPTFVLLPGDLSSLDPAIIDATFDVDEGPGGLAKACRRIGDRAVALAREPTSVLAVSDAAVGPGRTPVPSVLAVGAAHHALLRAGLRTRVGLVADAGDARDTHDVACLLGYGAEAIFPRTAVEAVTALCHEGRIGGDSPPAEEGLRRLRSALEDGVLKVMSKMGISTVDAYRGAQIFEAIGLSLEVIDLCLAETPSPLGGLSFRELGEDVIRRHQDGYGKGQALTNPGFIKHRAGGEFHANNPDVVDALHTTVGVQEAKGDGSVTRITDEMRQAHTLHRAVTGEGRPAYERFAALVEDRPPTAPRDLLDVVPAGPPIPLDDVEPADDIVRRFSTGAMSHGALSAEAHETLAVALNMVGGKANTGEGGEDRSRYRSHRNSGIKQVASGRFGVTPEYLAFAQELQIKMAQGSKPGEGGQLPGAKVSDEIARLRNTPPGVALISPPPHHDIYSIEDLAQLIFDLKQVNPEADVSVKLVSTVGVGTIAAGVVKGLAEVVHVAGAEGGTGASPLSSIKNAGLPWEIGLAETQEALAAGGLRGRARIRVDGGFKTGRDVILAALLGADEFSFGTAALMAEGCIMVRTCHRDTCPVGIASQRPELRAKFAGTPEMVATYLLHVAEDVRGHLAALGLRTVDDAVGRTDLLRRRDRGGPRADALDLTPLLPPPGSTRRFERRIPLQRIRSDLGDRLAADALPALAEGRIVELAYRIGNGDRAVGARLGGEVARRFGDRRPPGRVRVRFDGQAGQSFGAFLSAGVELDLTGEANDYVAKGMAGGSIVIRPPADDAGDPVLVGNTALYGATGGRLFVAGRAGERFAVRNSGAVAVVEGAGDHACEYMTGGAVVILGPVGHNMAAGMSGGEAYVHDPEEVVPSRVNPQLVEVRPPTPGQLPSLRRLIERHARATGSRRAEELLADWDRAATRFVRVMAKAEVALIEGALEGTAGGVS